MAQVWKYTQNPSPCLRHAPLPFHFVIILSILIFENHVLSLKERNEAINVMSTMEVQSKTKSVSVELISMYRSILEKARRELSKIELDLVMSMLRYQTKYPDKAPWARFEITFNPSIEPGVKKEELFEKIGRCAEIRHGNLFVIDAFITLEKLEEIARDKDIEHIEGTIVPI